MRDKWHNEFRGAKRNKAEPLLDGEAYYKSVIAAIQTASTNEHYIYILGWTMHVDFELVEGDPNKTLLGLLKAVDKKVEIRVLAWDNLMDYPKPQDGIFQLSNLPNVKAFLDSHTFYPQKSRDVLRDLALFIRRVTPGTVGDLLTSVSLLMDPNQDVPVAVLLSRLDSMLFAPTLGTHHDKVVIVKGKDGLIAFCGGMDFNKNRVISTVKKFNTDVKMRFPYYHDTACRLEGPAAHDILEKFKLRWNNHPQARAFPLRGEHEAVPDQKAESFPYAKVVGTYNAPGGSYKDRSLRTAYLKIIEKAELYIYIEDQYLVNLDVARALNKKLRETNFKTLFFATQDSVETGDILIPNRKRQEFMSAVLSGTTADEEKKVLLSAIDPTYWDQEFYHPGMHAKTLIVDDEIAIIGSANVSQRSFTNDSETCVIVFNDADNFAKNFARQFRMDTWKELTRLGAKVPDYVYLHSYIYPETINQAATSPTRFSKLIKYDRPSQDDLDVRIIASISSPIVSATVGVITGSSVLTQSTINAMANSTIPRVFNDLWDHFIDPKAD